jgi:predicted SprT family Zn-dependent metalloprotease
VSYSEANELKLLYVRLAAESLLKYFGLRHWVFDFNKRKTDFGLCKFPRNRKIKGGIIELSSPFVLVNEFDAINDVLLHEIAHALVGRNHNHDNIWKNKAEEIGAKPLRLIYNATFPAHSYRAICRKCEKRFYRYRQVAYNRYVYCPNCGKKHKLHFERYTPYA